MKSSYNLNFKSSDLLTKCELKLFFDRDPLYKAELITSKLIKYFYFNQQSQHYHLVKTEMPMNIKNINEYVVTMSRKLLLQSMIEYKCMRTNTYEKQINYYYFILIKGHWPKRALIPSVENKSDFEKWNVGLGPFNLIINSILINHCIGYYQLNLRNQSYCNLW
jgi:hypothetical protein